MGQFIQLTSVVGKTKNEVESSLKNYAISEGGGLEKEVLSTDDDNFCTICEADHNSTVFYSYAYGKWEQSSKFISKELKAPVFTFHIHDSDLWLYLFFVNGKLVDKFNPIPDYWDDELEDEEIKSWQGNAETISKYLNIEKSKIEKYLVTWDLDEDEIKAYPTDQYVNEDLQLLDFMKKLKLPYPLNQNEEPIGEVYKFWTKPKKRKSDENAST